MVLEPGIENTVQTPVLPVLTQSDIWQSLAPHWLHHVNNRPFGRETVPARRWEARGNATNAATTAAAAATAATTKRDRTLKTEKNSDGIRREIGWISSDLGEVLSYWPAPEHKEVDSEKSNNANGFWVRIVKCRRLFENVFILL